VPHEAEGDAAALAEAEAARLDAEYDQARLIALIDNRGHSPDGRQE